MAVIPKWDCNASGRLEVKDMGFKATPLNRYFLFYLQNEGLLNPFIAGLEEKL